MSEFRYASRMPAPARQVFAWHERPGAFERLTPPWEQVEVEERTGGIRDGARVVVRSRVGPFAQRWSLTHVDYTPGKLFRDIQVSGPFSAWDHRHIFEGNGDATSILEDRIEYTLPLGSLGRAVAGTMVHKRLERLFRYRHAITAGDLRLQNRPAPRTMKILVTGSTGLIGSALVPLLSTGGQQVLGLGRGAADSDAAVWDPATGEVSASALEGADAIVHLAGGPSIASGRWTARLKQQMRESRVEGTRRLCEFLARQPRRPSVLIAASAIGWYGDQGDRWLTEEEPAGTGFLADVCRAWEGATEPLARTGTRVVNLRIGVVLTPRGGALKQMLLPFSAGFGGQVGDGRQYMSWIGIDDVAGAIYHALMDDRVSGPVNATAPHPVTNREFTRTLGRVLKRPAFTRLPAFAARLALGEMADELLLASMRIRPGRLLETGYEFRHARLEPALRHVLGRAEG